jgi:hypothetical protein
MLGQGDLALQTETIGLLADLAYSPSNRAAALHALSAASSGGGLLGDLASSTIERLESDSTPWVSMTSVTLEALRSSAAGTVRTKKGDGSSGAVLVPARECSVLAVQAANRVVTDSMDGAYDRRRQAKLLECLYQSRALKSRQGLAEALLRPDGLTVICHGPAIHAVNLAVEFAAAVARLPGYCVRFGLSIGPVTLRRDVHGQIVVTGDGVSTAHIVAKHGDAGHVLASQYLVDKLTETDRRRLGLVDLGQRKYTDFMHVYNVTDLLGEYGRSEVPQGLIAHSRKMTRGTSVRRRRYAVALVLAAMVALAVAGYAVWRPDMCAEPGRRLLKLLRVSGTRNDPCTRDTPHAAPRRR